MSTATEMPESFAAGTSVEYTRSYADFPADDGWVLTVTLAGAGVLIAPTDTDGAIHVVTLTAAQTTELPAGLYQWAEKATKGDAVKIAASGKVIVEPNLDAAGAGELQSEAEKQLVLVNNCISELLANKAVVAYSVDGIAVTKADLKDLYAERARLQLAIARERRCNGFGRQHLMNLKRS